MGLLGRGFEAAVVALIALVAWRLLGGGIRTRGLLAARLHQPLAEPSGPDASGPRVDPERLQMLVVWLGGLGFYAADVLSTVGSGTRSLPDVPQPLLLGMAGSQLLYVAGKRYRTKGR